MPSENHFCVTREIRLTPVGEHVLEALLSVAVAEAEPHEVMPPVEAPAGWSQARREAFRAFHRRNYGGLDGPTRTAMYAVIHSGGDVVGAARLTRRDEAGTFETGLWLGQSARGQGIGLTTMALLLTEAARAGARAVVAETKPDNTAALRVLTRAGADLRLDGDVVRAEFCLILDGDPSHVT
jgi:RimJ/RimL family protein N-acetyltransferase